MTIPFMDGMLALDEAQVEGRRVLLRVDFNTPLTPLERPDDATGDGTDDPPQVVADDARIRAAIPTIRFLLDRGAGIVLCSHLGRPKGKPVSKFSLEPVAARLAELLASGPNVREANGAGSRATGPKGDVEILLAGDVVGPSARKLASELRPGQIMMLENVRFEAGEESNDPGLASQLAGLADVYVGDAFGASHRAHASVEATPRAFRQRHTGLLMAKELAALHRLRNDHGHPYVAVVGGAKVSDKIGVLEALLDRVDVLLIGGAMANTLLAARGYTMGLSLMEVDKLSMARALISRAKSKNVELRLPTDLVVSDSPDGGPRVVPVDAVGEGDMALDIGPQTVTHFRSLLERADTVFWNGPMGFFEKKAFASGTLGIARAMGAVTGYKVVGGGDSVAAVHKLGLESVFDHISTGGGASLEFLEGKRLPGVEALRLRDVEREARAFEQRDAEQRDAEQRDANPQDSGAHR